VIGVVDYGLGNVRAFENIYRRLGIAAAPVRTEEEMSASERIILPGVGAFDWAMERLTASGMLDALNRRVLDDHVPVLGVCVGMQIMARSSDEGGRPGLGWIEASVKRFDNSWFNDRTHLPHMGWNDVDSRPDCPLFQGLTQPQFYFLHSYFLLPDSDACVIGTTDYGRPFASAVRQGNIWATQFHPEKSHDFGVRILRNFAEL